MRSGGAGSSAWAWGPGCPTIGGRMPVPAVHTDYPLAAMGEELGLVGLLAVLGLYLVVVSRGLRIAAAAHDDFRSLLAAGLALVIGVQAFIIAGGNLKLIPLTGITLPFISYGGSSLLANALVIGLLLALSDRGAEPPPAPRDRPRRLPALPPPEGLGHDRASSDDRAPQATEAPLARHQGERVPDGDRGRLRLRDPRVRRRLVAGREAQRLSTAPDNPAVIAIARRALRGPIEDRNGQWLARSDRDANGEATREYRDDTISHVVGYASRRYGTAGLERTYNAQLLGLAGRGSRG